MISLGVDFLSEMPPPSYTLAFEPFLYNEEAYLRLKKGERYSFYAVDHAQRQVLARIHFVLVADASGDLRAVSLPESPFGSVEYGSLMNSSVLLSFVRFAVDTLKGRGVGVIEIRDCIPAYRPTGENSARLSSILEDVGFQKQDVSVNHHIKITKDALEEKMHRMEQKRLRKCKKANFLFQVEPLTRVGFYYGFLSRCRSEKGWNLSIGPKEMKLVTEELPKSYRIFALYHNQQCIAACIGVIVNRHIFYDLYHDSLRAYSAYSPVVMLIAHMYYHLRSHHIRMLDMGTSLTPSLQSFKARVGGEYSSKITFAMLM